MFREHLLDDHPNPIALLLRECFELDPCDMIASRIQVTDFSTENKVVKGSFPPTYQSEELQAQQELNVFAGSFSFFFNFFLEFLYLKVMVGWFPQKHFFLTAECQEFWVIFQNFQICLLDALRFKDGGRLVHKIPWFNSFPQRVLKDSLSFLGVLLNF